MRVGWPRMERGWPAGLGQLAGMRLETRLPAVGVGWLRQARRPGWALVRLREPLAGTPESLARLPAGWHRVPAAPMPLWRWGLRLPVEVR